MLRYKNMNAKKLWYSIMETTAFIGCIILLVQGKGLRGLVVAGIGAMMTLTIGQVIELVED